MSKKEENARKISDEPNKTKEKKISYKENVGQLLKDRGFNYYAFKKNGEDFNNEIIHQATIANLNKDADEIDADITLSTAFKICYLLDKKIEDIVEYEPDQDIIDFKERVLEKTRSKAYKGKETLWEAFRKPNSYKGDYKKIHEALTEFEEYVKSKPDISREMDFEAEIKAMIKTMDLEKDKKIFIGDEDAWYDDSSSRYHFVWNKETKTLMWHFPYKNIIDGEINF